MQPAADPIPPTTREPVEATGGSRLLRAPSWRRAVVHALDGAAIGAAWWIVVTACYRGYLPLLRALWFIPLANAPWAYIRLMPFIWKLARSPLRLRSIGADAPHFRRALARELLPEVRRALLPSLTAVPALIAALAFGGGPARHASRVVLSLSIGGATALLSALWVALNFLGFRRPEGKADAFSFLVAAVARKRIPLVLGVVFAYPAILLFGKDQGADPGPLLLAGESITLLAVLQGLIRAFHAAAEAFFEGPPRARPTSRGDGGTPC